MALNLTGESPFAQGAEQGTNIFQKLMQPYMQAQQLAQQYQMHLDELPAKNALRDAQMQEALAAAQEKSFLFNLMNSGKNSVSPTQNTQSTSGYGSTQVKLPPINTHAVDKPNTSLDMSQMPSWLQQRFMEKQPQTQPQKQTQPPVQSQEMSGVVDMQSAPIGSSIVLDAGNPSLYKLDRFAGIGRIPDIKESINPVTGNRIVKYPSGKTVETKLAPSQLELAQGKSDIEATTKKRELFDKADAEVATEYTKSRGDIAELGRIYNSVQKDLDSPEWRKLKAQAFNQFGAKVRDLGIEAYKTIGDKKTQDVIGRVESNLGRLVAEYAKVFKGAFRMGEQQLLENVKPTPGEPLAVQLGKLSQLQEANKFANHLAQRIPVLIRKENMTADEAYDVALQEIDADKWFNNLQKEQEQATQAQNNGQPDYLKMSAAQFTDYISKLSREEKIKLLETGGV